MSQYEQEEEMPSNSGTKRIQWSGSSEIFSPLPPVPWLIPELFLGPGRPAMMAGYSYTAKSISAQAIAISVASGRPVWERFRVTNPGRVLHFDLEQGRYGTFRRYQRLAHAIGVTAADIEANLQVTCFPDVYLSTPDVRSLLETECAGARLAIIDSLRAATPGVDENDSVVRTYIDNLSAVSDSTGCTFLVVHHAGKGRAGGDQREAPRGSSAIFDACGLVLNMRAHDSKEQDVTLSRLSMSKSPAEAEGGARSDFYLRVSDVADPVTRDQHAGLECRFQTVEQVEEGQTSGASALRRQVEDFIRRFPGASKSEIRAAIPVRGINVDGVLDALERVGRVRVESNGRKQRHFVVDDDGED
jgi:hypothetical protein